MQQKILVVGGDQTIHQSLSDALGHSQYQLLISANGSDALLQFDISSPDLVILDLLRLGADGWDILHRLRDLSAVPIIVLSNPADQKAEVNCLNSGADYFLTRPFGIHELCARIRALLRRVTPLGGCRGTPNYPRTGRGQTADSFSV